jgi:hypothetical protein
MLGVGPAVFVKMQAAREMSLNADFPTEAAGDDFLQHREAEYVVG